MIAEKFYVATDTEYGPVVGIKKFTDYGEEYYSFQGIPYMKAPVGKLRFRNAEPPEPWTEVFDATYERPGFVSIENMMGRRFDGELEGVHVNIYTKNMQSNNLTPVMVYIHGGSFRTLSGGTDICGPDYIMQKNVILVTFNYRMGPFGFLSLKDPSLNIPGNAGLKDQVFALKFIKNNIANFGGDPENITIFGESAGGVCVHFHTISDLSKNLFQRAIIMSGCALNKTWSTVPDRNWAHKLAVKMEWDEKGGEQGMLEFLEKAGPFRMAGEQYNMNYVKEELETEIIECFGPVVEPYISENCFIPKNPVLMAREGWGNNIDVMIGGCSREGLLALFFARAGLGKYYYREVSMERYTATELELKKDDEKRKIYGNQVKNLYYGNDRISLANLDGYVDHHSDMIFWYGLYRSILSRANSEGTGKTFIYRFDYFYPKFNFVRFLGDIPDKYKGTCHMDDLGYIFKTKYLPAPQIGTKEYEAVKKTVEIFTSFAIHGNPNSNELGEIVIESVTNKTPPFKCVNIAENLEMIDFPEHNRFELWNTLYRNENIPIF